MKPTDSSLQTFSADKGPKRTVGCVIMASGKSVRFGSNKLMADFGGKNLLQRILDTTEGLFDARVVVTRSHAAASQCRAQGVEVIFHDLPYRSDAVQLGTTHLLAMDGLIFCPCDQPLLRRESLEALLASPAEDQTILRLACGETLGTPFYFGRAHFQALCQLPDKAGGSYLAKGHPELVRLVPIQDPRELMDVDTPEDLCRLLETLNERKKTRYLL